MLPNLSIRQLQTFREVMRAGSVSGAARTLGRTQPTVSAMLANLESELGFDLFEREKRRLKPKPEAHFFLEEAEEILARVRRSAVTMKEIGDLDRGTLKIASMPGASHFLLPKIVGDFVKGHPGLKASLMTRSSVKVQEWIASQQYDIGFAEPPPPTDSIRVQPLDLVCVCALRADDPRAQKEVLTPADLDGAPLAVLFKEHFTFSDTKRAFEDSRAAFNPRFETSIFVPALKFVELGLAYAIVDPVTPASYPLYNVPDAKVCFRKFEPSLIFKYAILTPAHRPLSILAEAFLAQLRTEVLLFASSTAQQQTPEPSSP